MRKGQFYRHENCEDMVVFVLRAVPVPKGGKFKVHYHGLSAVDRKPYPMGVMEEIFIAREDLGKWKFYAR
jgi:hypothetical protein